MQTLGLSPGDAVFVPASQRSVGQVIGGARTVIEALLQTAGAEGVVALPGFSNDASLPDWASGLPEAERA